MHLLDVNVLIALLWPGHVAHSIAIRWFSAHPEVHWATCAFTQAGFVRISSQPAAPESPNDAMYAAQVLAKATQAPEHNYLSMDFDYSTVRQVCTGGILGHRQITDAWLLATAVHHHCKLVTLDSGIRQLLATDAERSRHLVILSN
jgi:uncharacterized protein